MGEWSVIASLTSSRGSDPWVSLSRPPHGLVIYREIGQYGLNTRVPDTRTCRRRAESNSANRDATGSSLEASGRLWIAPTSLGVTGQTKGFATLAPQSHREALARSRLRRAAGDLVCHHPPMPMSDEHKAALAEGRKQARAIKSYLRAIASRKPGRPVTREGLESRLAKVSQKLESADNPLDEVELIQSRLDIEKALADLEEAADMSELEAGFVEHAAAYSERKGITYTAWREFGVPASVLRSAGIKETRRR